MKKLMLAFAATVAMTGAAFAQEAAQCITTDELAKIAKEQHFVPKSVGKVIVPGHEDADVAMMLFTGPKGKWQMMMLSSKGAACVVAFGTDYQESKSAPADDKGI